MVSMFSLFLLLIEQSPLVASLQQSQRHIVGVPWEKQHLYDSNEPDLTKWHCLNHEDIVLDISQINDGVCDCPDGSDEPGSAACVEDIFKSVAEGGGKVNKYFYCDNKGFIPRYIRKSEVADGICDCCDCSDELLSGYELFDAGSNCSQLKNEFDIMASKELSSYREGKEALEELERKYGTKEEAITRGNCLEENKEKASAEIKVLSNRLSENRAKLEQLRGEYFNQLSHYPILYQFEQLNSTRLGSDILTSFTMVSRVSKGYQDIFKILSDLSEAYTPSLNDKVVNDNIKKFRKVRRRAEKAKINADSKIDDEQADNLYLYFTEEVPQIFLKRESENTLRYVIGKSNFVQALVEGKINYTNDILEYIREFRLIMDDISQNYNVNFQDAGVKSAVDSYKNYLGEYGELAELEPAHPSESLLRSLSEVTSFVNENAPKVLPPDAVESEQDTNSDHIGTSGDLRNKLKEILSKLNIFSSRKDLVSLEKRFRSCESQVSLLENELKQKMDYKKLLDETEDEGTNSTAGNLTELLELMGSQSYCLDDILDNYVYTICFQRPMTEGVIYQAEDKVDGKKVLIGRFKTSGFNVDLNMEKYAEHLKATYDEKSDLISNLAAIQDDDGNMQHYVFGNLNELNKGLVLEYENGDQCWNGPRRSATVFVRCSDKFKIRSVHEATKCNYIFDVVGPLGCNKTFEYEPPKFNLSE
ncbi:ASB_HP2_G0011070.mRNA.1.CDS.1 [Saccharomyces cerevisiae]|nr:ASB_HP2_G0011070.mRNA.1.CDS.1 [Saccharomyces cerevisiae]CAI6436160.1 ASB_HP1_G0010860.mRNA.1.CDS.1 [Saccharomyces cerevisiae]CAI6437570.1 ASB_HP2_G0011070.mRNA.1.CDS.1 [Saccharomyces cerevisiae]